MKKFNAFQLKLFMVILMVFDHLENIPGLLPAWLPEIFHVLTRCVAPLFAFMAVEGFIHTRSRFKYNARLFIWSAIMFGGNTIINKVIGKAGLFVQNNIIFTLACGVLVLNVWCYKIHDKHKNAKLLKTTKVIIAIPVTLIACIAYEGSLVVVPFMLICYFFRNNIKARNIYALIFGFILFFSSINIMQSLEMTIKMMMYNSDWLFITVLPIISLYNGERGSNSIFTKYFFYIFYPLHLWIISLIAYVSVM